MESIQEFYTVENDESTRSRHETKENMTKLSESESNFGGASEFMGKQHKFGKLKSDLADFNKERSKSNACNYNSGEGLKVEENGFGSDVKVKPKNANKQWDMYEET